MSRMLRAIDADINRSLEGLRVCEDILRFYCGDTDAAKIKALRHSLLEAAGAFSRDGLLEAREVAADEQKFINLETEMKRETPFHVFTANIRRAAEAVRSLEELSKLEEPDVGARFQKVRFRIYELEKENWFTLKKSALMQAFDRGLYCIADAGFLNPPDIPRGVSDMAAGGAKIIQLRMKNHERGTFLSVAREVAAICCEAKVLFVVNDYADIAALVESDGLHLGQDDIPVNDARRVVAPGTVIGLSTHSVAQAREAGEQNPDYIAIGPVFGTASKTGETIEGIGCDVVADVVKEATRPVVAIGGITRENLGQVMAAGCRVPAIISDIFRGGSLKANCSELSRMINEY